jgi:DNA-directed RNA polymerase specialized sigma24 family protein
MRADYPGRGVARFQNPGQNGVGLTRIEPSTAQALAASSFLRTLHKALAQRAEREVALALKVAYALERGMTADEIAARLDVSRGEVLDATRRIERARGGLDRQ